MNVEIDGIDLCEAVREHCEINVLLKDYGWVVIDSQESVESSNMWFIDDNNEEVYFSIDDVVAVEI